MSTAKTGDRVKVHYKGQLEDGQVFTDSRGNDPLEFTIGEKSVIPGFEEAVEGMDEGEKRTEKIPCDQAFGPRRDDLVASIDRDELPDDIDPQVGQQLQMQQDDGQDFTVMITDKDDSTITVDANHPLAGQDLTFEIELLEIQ